MYSDDAQLYRFLCWPKVFLQVEAIIAGESKSLRPPCNHSSSLTPHPHHHSTTAIHTRIIARTHARTLPTRRPLHTVLTSKTKMKPKTVAHRTFGASVFVPPKRAKGFSHHNSKSSEDQGNHGRAQGRLPLNQSTKITTYKDYKDI